MKLFSAAFGEAGLRMPVTVNRLQGLFGTVVMIGLYLNACSPRQLTRTDILETSLYQAKAFTGDSLFSGNIEGPAFDALGNLFVVNVEKDGTIGQVSAEGVPTLFVTLPPNSIANAIQFNRRGDMLLADFKAHNILKVETASRHVSVFTHSPRFNQPNDICINRRDQLFASDPNWKESTGQIWRIDPDGSIHLLDTNMGTTNGIELSPDERTLYVNESVQRRVWKYLVDVNGNISDKQLLIQFNDYGMDGMKCDREGNLYITRYGKGTIVVVSPDGKVIREIALRGKNCSNLVFGGPDGRTVFVTLQDTRGMEQFRVEVPGKKFR